MATGSPTHHTANDYFFQNVFTMSDGKLVQKESWNGKSDVISRQLTSDGMVVVSPQNIFNDALIGGFLTGCVFLSADHQHRRYRLHAHLYPRLSHIFTEVIVARTS